MSWTLLIESMAAGLVGGVLGGFLGIGGGLVLIPALAIFFGEERQHLHQAAVMVVNVIVSISAVLRHWRAGAVRMDALSRIVPATLICIVIGVYLGNQLDGEVLARLFALFLVYVMWTNTRKAVVEFRRAREARAENATDEQKAAVEERRDPARERITWPRGSLIGGVMGTLAGLLGIGGGSIAVPLQQVTFRIPLKECIGTSSAAIALTAGAGAIVKNATLHQVGYTIADSLALIAALAPGALAGGYIGAHLTHLAPTRWVRVVFVGLMIISAVKMSGLDDLLRELLTPRAD